ncbi:putative 6-phosphofructo-2-kinase PB17E12.14c [Ceratocystis lukuohia]|uniref:6-phosphofructo-2-kinase PB17E12.14c n=1 Tax=Ceratocystis lukuohia TaxID=2019550 RepID=A0ABR4MSE9_9PEZI
MNNNQANTTPTSIHRPPTEADFALSSLTSSTQFNARPHTQSQTKLPSTQPVIQQNGLPTPSTTPGATTPVLAVTRSLQECQISGNVPIPMTTSPTSLSNPSSSALGAQSVGFLPLPPNAPSSSPPQSGPESKSETPLSGMSMPSTATSSPRLPPLRQNSGSQTPRVRPHATTLNIPGMTRSKASPDGKIAERDVAAKLVIVMVGLPARGKSYITNKLQRYLSWQQHNSRIFNVGNRRRVVAGLTPATALPDAKPSRDASKVASMILGGGPVNLPHPPELNLNDPNMDQSAQFFDPSNTEAAKLREQVAMATLDELLDYLLLQGGSIGILDATNSTLKRRQMIVERIKARDDKLGILFIESICNDKDLLEANMRLKLSGPDYRDKDPNQSLEDFRRRVHAYEKAYTPLGEWEEKNDLQYIQMINVGQKIIQYRLRGFLSGGIASYLASFNLSPRQIWITRHGVSVDNEAGKLGGDSELTERGHIFGHDLYEFMTQKRKEWLYEQTARTMNSSFPPLPGDHTPPYPEINRELNEKNFCIWTSMMKRSVETAEYFEADEDYDVKNWEMLNELNAGNFEGMTYKDIEERHPEEYKKRQNDKLNYIYPGVGGEGYLQVISRMRDMVREIERITDHLLVIGHRSVCRVLMAYFMDFTQQDIADMDVPLGMVFAIEPKPYGIQFHAYRYNEETRQFNELPDYKPQRISSKTMS